MKEKIKTVVHKARKQPVHVRRQLALWITIICMVIIVFVWIFTFKFSTPRAATAVSSSNTTENTGVVDTIFSPFTVIKNAFEGFSLKSESIINQFKQK